MGICADGAWPIPPSVYSADKPFISWIATELIKLGALVYAFDALLRMMPNLARQLSGPAFAPQLGGGTGFGAIQMPGFSHVGRLKEQVMFQAKSNLFTKFAQWQSSAAATGSGGGAPPKAPGPAQQARNQAARLAGGKKPPP